MQKDITVLAVFVLSLVCCKKKQPHPTDHTHKMAGVRHWHGTETLHKYRVDSVGNLYPFDSVIEYIDDSFSISVVNNKEIFTSIISSTLSYSYSDDSTIRFSYEQYAGHGRNSTDEIVYYFLDDRIKFHGIYYHPINNEANVLDLETP